MDMGILEAANIDHWCAICNKSASEKHHLFPRSTWGRIGKDLATLLKIWTAKIWVCRECHVQIHCLFRNYELAARFNTSETLKLEIEKRKAVIEH